MTTTNRDLLENKEHVKEWRVRYIFKKKELEFQGCKFYYTDETWYNTADCKTRGWQRNDLKETQVQQRSAGKGARFIICAIGGKDGFLEGESLIFHDKDEIYADYHKSLTATVYEQ